MKRSPDAPRAHDAPRSEPRVIADAISESLAARFDASSAARLAPTVAESATSAEPPLVALETLPPIASKPTRMRAQLEASLQ